MVDVLSRWKGIKEKAAAEQGVDLNKVPQSYGGEATPLPQSLANKMQEPMEGHFDEKGRYVPAVRPVTETRSYTQRTGRARIDS
jgi:hypothetical protein